MNVREWTLSFALLAVLTPFSPGGGSDMPTTSGIQLAGIAGTGGPQNRMDCDRSNENSTAGCRPAGDGKELGATDRGG